MINPSITMVDVQAITLYGIPTYIVIATTSHDTTTRHSFLGKEGVMLFISARCPSLYTHVATLLEDLP